MRHLGKWWDQTVYTSYVGFGIGFHKEQFECIGKKEMQGYEINR